MTERKNATRLGVAAGAALVMVLAAVWIARAARERGASASGREAAPAAARAQPVPPPAPPDAARAAAPVGADAATAARAAAPRGDALVAALRRAGRAFAARDPAAIEESLALLVADPDTLLAILALLRDEALAGDAEAALGALVAIEAGVAVHGAHGGDPLAARGAVRAVLLALPGLPEEARAKVVARLVAARAAGRAVLDARFLRDVLDLRLAWPELASEFSPLFAHLGEGLDPEARFDGFYQLVASEAGDPTAVRVALSTLLAEGAAAFLPLAEELFARSEDPAMRAAVLAAIAAGAPVERAAEAFGRLAGAQDMVSAVALGTRPGGAEALRLEYERRLAAGGGDADARRALVSGLVALPPDELRALAGRDPSPDVRAQAWLTATFHHGADARAAAELVQAFELGDGLPGGLGAGAAALAAENLLAGGDAAAREAAGGLLLRIAGDTELARAARVRAARALAARAPGLLPPALEPLLH